MKKKIFFFVSTVLLITILYNRSAIQYGLGQGYGQLKIIWNAVPIEDIVNDPNTPDSVLNKIALIQEVRNFAIDSLGMEDSPNYTTYYDQKGEPILWVVTASPEFKIEAYEWSFPIAGSFSYKGFFELEKAENEAKNLQKLGYDTEIDEVAAWSTLGWFKDPILSSMLIRSEGKLAELIFHELTHSTVYLKDQIEYNENLANFIGKQAAQLFLRSKYGEYSHELSQFLSSFEKRKVFADFITQTVQELNSFYAELPENLTIEEKRTHKEEKINELKMGLLKLNYYEDSLIAKKRIEKFTPNNAFFSGFSTYTIQQDTLGQLLHEKYKGSLKDFISDLKNTKSSF